MYTDAMRYCENCAECAIAMGVGKKNKPPLYPIPVKRPFQILGIYVMELPRTSKGNRYVIVMQDFLTKWPLVFPSPDQKATRISQLLVDKVLPTFGVADCGTNMLANVVKDTCQLLGITKLNTTAYHPQCDGMVERFNRTLKSMLRKYAVKFNNQWDRYLQGVLWACRNTPHESTKEKPSYLLFGVDLRSPIEAAFLLPEELQGCTDISEYREEAALSLASARELAAANIEKAQQYYKHQCDRHTTAVNYRVYRRCSTKFPQEESGKNRKLSRPWHGPYRITQRNDPDLTVTKQFFPEEGTIQIHQLRVCPCPQLPVGFYWYGGTRHSAGGVPRWVEELTQNGTLCEDPTEDGQVETEIDDLAQGEDEPILIPNELENGDLTCLGDSNNNLQHDQGNGKDSDCTCEPDGLDCYDDNADHQ